VTIDAQPCPDCDQTDGSHWERGTASTATRLPVFRR
jgi:hypothetical protein